MPTSTEQLNPETNSIASAATQTRNATLDLVIDPRHIFLMLTAIIVTLHGLSAAAIWADFAEINYFEDIDKFFDVGRERNIPTIYSVLAWALAALTTGLIASNEKIRNDAFVNHWRTLAFIFLFLAFDEGATIHEHVGDFAENWVTPSGYFYFMWVVPYGVIVILLAALYAPFLDQLPNPTKFGLVLSALVFLGGALGVEMISAAIYEDKTQRNSFLYHALYSVEEFMEMMGVAILNFFLLDHLKRRTQGVSVTWQQ